MGGAPVFVLLLSKSLPCVKGGAPKGRRDCGLSDISTYLSCVEADARIRPRDRLAGKMMPASQQSWLARAVQCPTGALIASRPRNASIDPYNCPER